MKKFIVATIGTYRKLNLWAREHHVFGITYTTCKFHPSCSEFAQLAIEKHGPLKGTKEVFKRIVRCRPFAEGGIDLP